MLVVLRVMEVRPNLMVLLLSHLSLYLGFYRHGAVRSLCHGPLGMLLFRGHGLSISWLVAGPTPFDFESWGSVFTGVKWIICAPFVIFCPPIIAF